MGGLCSVSSNFFLGRDGGGEKDIPRNFGAEIDVGLCAVKLGLVGVLSTSA